MDILDIIFEIEDKDIEIDKDWYYHAFGNNIENFIEIIDDGIKSSVLLNDKTCGLGDNGKYYICVSKNMNLEEYSSYEKYSRLPRFILDKNIKAVHARRDRVYPYFCINSILPFRESSYDDEYQVFLKVKTSSIIGISYNIYNNYDKYYGIKDDLKLLKKMVIELNKRKIDLPIIDSSTKLEINKEKVLSLDI